MTQHKERRKRTWCVMDLVTDHATGKLRESSLWSNGIKAAVLVSYCRFVTPTNFGELTAIASGILITHEAISRVLNQRQQAIAPIEPPKV